VSVNRTASISSNKFRVPDGLAERDQWVLWRYESRDGKSTKVPYQPNGCRADSTDSRTWATFEIALNAWRRYRQRYAGLGFVFAKDGGLAGIDLDDSLDEQHNVKTWAQRIVEQFGDTYLEISPSGQGLKIWVQGSLPTNVPGVKIGDGSIELYDHARYFAVTGRAFRGAPFQIENHTNDLLLLYDRLTAGRKNWLLEPLPGGQIPYGQQHSTLVSLCGTLRVRGVCEEAIEACLQVVNQSQCEIPGPVQNISRIVRSSRKWGRR
jgi:primase-polymerase (primpol)-like protein